MKYNWVKIASELEYKVPDFDVHPSELYQDRDRYFKKVAAVFTEPGFFASVCGRGFRASLRCFKLAFESTRRSKSVERPPAKFVAPRRRPRTTD